MKKTGLCSYLKAWVDVRSGVEIHPSGAANWISIASVLWLDNFWVATV